MDVNRSFNSRAFKKSVKNVPNLKLKGDTFDASHLSQFILEDQVCLIFLILKDYYEQSSRFY